MSIANVARKLYIKNKTQLLQSIYKKILTQHV